MINNKIKFFFIKASVVSALLLAGLFFRIYEQAPASLWTDELATAWVSTANSANDVIQRSVQTQGQSPFYFLLEYYILKLIPISEFSLRLLSLVVSLLSIYIIYEFGTIFFSRNFSMNEKTLFSREPKQKIHTKGILSASAIFLAILFIIDPVHIYYAQEARPYALATFFALLSQLFFIKLFIPEESHLKRIFNYSFFVLFSTLICYAHYIFGVILILQNIWVISLILKTIIFEKSSDNKISTHKTIQWLSLQFAIFILTIPLFTQILDMAKNSKKWTWLKQASFSDLLSLFINLFDLRAILFCSIIYALLLLYGLLRNFPVILKQYGKIKISHKAIFVILSIFIPLFSLYFAGEILHSSFCSPRYLTPSMFGAYIALASFVNFMPNSALRISIAAIFVSVHIAGVLIPNYKRYHRFSKKIPHNWRNALRCMNQNIKPKDIIILRSGFIKENWIPLNSNEIISEYVKSPLKSFYFKPDFLTRENKEKDSTKFFQIYNMTFSRETEFYDYYDKIFLACSKAERIWVVGVNPPNTNYQISQVPELLRKSHQKIFENFFSGVYLVLMKKNK